MRPEVRPVLVIGERQREANIRASAACLAGDSIFEISRNLSQMDFSSVSTGPLVIRQYSLGI